MINRDFQNLPNGYRLTERGPLPKEGQVMWLGSVEEERARREVMVQLELEQSKKVT